MHTHIVTYTSVHLPYPSNKIVIYFNFLQISNQQYKPSHSDYCRGRHTHRAYIRHHYAATLFNMTMHLIPSGKLHTALSHVNIIPRKCIILCRYLTVDIDTLTLSFNVLIEVNMQTPSLSLSTYSDIADCFIHYRITIKSHRKIKLKCYCHYFQQRHHDYLFPWFSTATTFEIRW